MNREQLAELVNSVQSSHDQKRQENSYNLYRQITLEEAMGTGSAHDLDPHLHGLLFDVARQVALLKKVVCKVADLDESIFDEVAGDVFHFPEALPGYQLLVEGPEFHGD